MQSARKTLAGVLTLAAFVLAACGAPAQESGGQAQEQGSTAASGGSDSSESSTTASGEYTLPQRIVESGKLVVGMDTTYAPMEFLDDDGNVTGFDVDFARALAAEMGIEVEFESVSWDGIIPGLLSKRYDVIISSMNITPERLEQIDFVEYVKMSQVFVTHNDAEPIKTEADLAGRVIAVQADTTSQEWVEKLPSEYQPKEVRKFVDNNAVYLEIASGRAEGAVTDEPVGRYFAQRYKDKMAVTGLAMDPEPVGIGIRKDDQELKAALEKAVAAIKADGTYEKISQEWFGGELGK